MVFESLYEFSYPPEEELTLVTNRHLGLKRGFCLIHAKQGQVLKAKRNLRDILHMIPTKRYEENVSWSARK